MGKNILVCRHLERLVFIYKTMLGDKDKIYGTKDFLMNSKTERFYFDTLVSLGLIVKVPYVYEKDDINGKHLKIARPEILGWKIMQPGAKDGN